MVDLHIKTSQKRGGGPKLKDYLSRNDKKSVTNDPPFSTINQQESSKATFFQQDDSDPVIMMTGDFRKSAESHPVKNTTTSSPIKRQLRSGNSLSKRQLSPQRFGAHSQKPESIDLTASVHSRNDSKTHNVFNSKISDAIRSGGGFSSIRGANSTPLGFNLT